MHEVTRFGGRGREFIAGTASKENVQKILQEGFYEQWLKDRGGDGIPDVEMLKRALHDEYKCGVVDAIEFILSMTNQIEITYEGNNVTKIVAYYKED